MKLARYQNKSLQECMQSNTSLEFIDWCIYDQELKWQEKEKIDYYLAQIASEIRRIATAFGGDKSKTSIQDCILLFEMTEGKESKTLLSQEPRTHRSPRLVQEEEQEILPQTLRLQEEEVESEEIKKPKYKNPFEYHPGSIWVPLEGEEVEPPVPIPHNEFKRQARTANAMAVWSERRLKGVEHGES